MQIYTSNFNSIPLLKDKLVPIAICLEIPPDYTGKWLHEPAPTYDILHQYQEGHDTELYTRRFTAEILAHLDPADIYTKINELAEGKDCALLCYEEKDEFCHRHLVADWLNHHLNLMIKEFDDEPQGDHD